MQAEAPQSARMNNFLFRPISHLGGSLLQTKPPGSYFWYFFGSLLQKYRFEFVFVFVHQILKILSPLLTKKNLNIIWFIEIYTTQFHQQNLTKWHQNRFINILHLYSNENFCCAQYSLWLTWPDNQNSARLKNFNKSLKIFKNFQNRRKLIFFSLDLLLLPTLNVIKILKISSRYINL